jgi:hypothetical protein
MCIDLNYFHLCILLSWCFKLLDFDVMVLSCGEFGFLVLLCFLKIFKIGKSDFFGIVSLHQVGKRGIPPAGHS